MAKNKTKRWRKRNKAAVLSRLQRFPEVTGKTVETVEIDDDATAITIVFRDKTILSFDLDPILAVYPELSAHKRGEWKPIKRWPRVSSSPTMVKWP
jgi:hypothetical protein